MVDILVIVAILALLSGAGLYIYRSKKKGRKCIGCPDSGACSGGCAGCSGKCSEH